MTFFNTTEYLEIYKIIRPGISNSSDGRLLQLMLFFIFPRTFHSGNIGPLQFICICNSLCHMSRAVLLKKHTKLDLVKLAFDAIAFYFVTLVSMFNGHYLSSFFVHNVEKWSNILSTSCSVMKTARF